jgi:hypothetical protein
MSEEQGAVRCGAFVAINTGYNSWKIVCDRLPGWEHHVEATRATAARLVIQLQAEYRNTWEVRK